jgi:hypothetical protein
MNGLLEASVSRGLPVCDSDLAVRSSPSPACSPLRCLPLLASRLYACLHVIEGDLLPSIAVHMLWGSPLAFGLPFLLYQLAKHPVAVHGRTHHCS